MDKKGLIEIYDKTCIDLCDESFIEWIEKDTGTFQPGQFCYTVVSYTKSKKWYLEEAHYDPMNEQNSTWYAREFFNNYPSSNPPHVMKYFELEKEERLITTISKERPVILLNRTLWDWLNPSIEKKHIPLWVTVPLFTYKPRHPQKYVLDHQRMKNSFFFYVPSRYAKCPGPNEESAGVYQSIQMVNERHLLPLKHRCQTMDPIMARPFKLSSIGLRLMMYHFYKGIGVFPELELPETEYNLFVEQINILIDAAFSSS